MGIRLWNQYLAVSYICKYCLCTAMHALTRNTLRQRRHNLAEAESNKSCQRILHTRGRSTIRILCAGGKWLPRSGRPPRSAQETYDLSPKEFHGHRRERDLSTEVVLGRNGIRIRARIDISSGRKHTTRLTRAATPHPLTPGYFSTYMQHRRGSVLVLAVRKGKGRVSTVPAAASMNVFTHGIL